MLLLLQVGVLLLPALPRRAAELPPAQRNAPVLWMVQLVRSTYRTTGIDTAGKRLAGKSAISNDSMATRRTEGAAHVRIVYDREVAVPLPEMSFASPRGCCGLTTPTCTI